MKNSSANAGWEHMGEMSGWQYFRKQAVGGELPEIYSDNESKAKKYQRLMLFLIIFIPIYSTFISILKRSANSMMQVVTLLMAVFVVFYTYAMIRLLQRIIQLKKKI